MDHKITINNKEYDTRDFSEQQKGLLDMINLANSDLFKARARVELVAAGREAALRTLTQSVEAIKQSTQGEAND